MKPYTLFYKNNFISTKALTLVKKNFKNKLRAKPFFLTEHENKVSRLVILKTKRKEYQNRARLAMYCM